MGLSAFSARGRMAASYVLPRDSSGQQVERHGCTHSMICSNNSSSGRGHGRNRSVHYFAGRSFMVRQCRVARGGNRSDQIGESIFKIETSFLVEYDVYLFTTKMKTR